MTDEPVMRISPDYLADTGVRAILQALPEARVVGGAVRDAIAGRAVADVDFATPERPEAVVAALGQAGIRSVPTGLDHGTITAVVAGCGFEVTTLRRDVETDGRHAVVAFTTDWKADAARRDFTINAMSMRGDGAVFDYFGGLADLRAGIVRFVGEPAARIAEDYLRILRYFRFYARYAAAPPDAELGQAINDGIAGMAGLSVERVWSELVRILSTPDPRSALHLMSRLGVLRAVLPEAGELASLDRLVAAGAPPDPILRLAAILSVLNDPEATGAEKAAPEATRPEEVRPEQSRPEQSRPGQSRPGQSRPGQSRPEQSRRERSKAEKAGTQTAATQGARGSLSALAARLKLSVADRDRLLALGGTPVPDPLDDDDALRRMLADTDAATLIGRTWLAGDDDPSWAALRQRLAATPRPVFPLAGRDVLALGLAAGPLVGALLQQVRAWWLAGGCRADAPTCRAELLARAGTAGFPLSGDAPDGPHPSA